MGREPADHPLKHFHCSQNPFMGFPSAIQAETTARGTRGSDKKHRPETSATAPGRALWTAPDSMIGTTHIEAGEPSLRILQTSA
jgi:hypothetical protein